MSEDKYAKTIDLYNLFCFDPCTVHVDNVGSRQIIEKQIIQEGLKIEKYTRAHSSFVSHRVLFCVMQMFTVMNERSFSIQGAANMM